MAKEIHLSQGKVAIVDDSDYELVSQYKWTTMHTPGRKTWYAYHSDWNKGNPRSIILHCFLMSAPKGTEVDHIDGDGLNCQRHNLRMATRSENSHNVDKRCDNTSGYKGVMTNKRRWRFSIQSHGRRITKGGFKTAEDAARAYDAAAKILHGEYAYLNFPEHESSDTPPPQSDNLTP